jgi:hypothetical protein
VNIYGGQLPTYEVRVSAENLELVDFAEAGRHRAHLRVADARRHHRLRLGQALELQWTIAPRLKLTPGIADVNIYGGQLPTYEVRVSAALGEAEAPDHLLLVVVLQVGATARHVVLGERGVDPSAR